MAFDRAVFLDRDGIINWNLYYPDTAAYEGPRVPEDFQLYPWTAKALSLLSSAGYALILVSNQPNFAKGKSSLEDLAGVHRRLLDELGAKKISLLASYYCLHHPVSSLEGYSACQCRKPSPKFLLDATDAYGVDLSRSWMVGDRASDVECGRRAGVRTIRVCADHENADSGVEYPIPDYVASNLLEAATIILEDK